MSAASDQGGCRKKLRMPEPNAASSVAQLPTAQTSTASAPVAREAGDSSKGLLCIKNISRFDEKIFEAFSTLKEQNVLDTNTIASYIEDGDDYINKLMDEILVLILSFMSTRDAIRTSLVSQRWKNLWVEVPKLEIYSWRHKELIEHLRPSNFEMYKYVYWVNEAVKLHDTRTTLEVFSICFPLDSNYSDDINRWIEFAARKQVKKLELDFCIKSSASTTESYTFLASLAANRFFWLKDLYLRGINVEDVVIECLFSNSPFIERLSIIDSKHLCNFVVADAPNLKYLELVNCHFLYRLDISAPNLNIFKLWLRQRVVSSNISAPVISSISITFNLKPKPTGGYNFDHAHTIWEILECLHDLLGHFSHVNKKLCLTVSDEVWLEICKLIDIYHWLPELSDVEHLKFTIRKPFLLWHLHERGPHPPKWVHFGHLWPCALVKRAPSLRKLTIDLLHINYKLPKRLMDAEWKDDDDLLLKVRALTSINEYYSRRHLNLKVVELLGFTGCVNEVEFVLYLVEIAVSLEKIIINIFEEKLLWSDSDIKRFKQNEHAEFSCECAEVLKTLIRPDIYVEIRM